MQHLWKQELYMSHETVIDGVTQAGLQVFVVVSQEVRHRCKHDSYGQAFGDLQHLKSGLGVVDGM